MTPCSDPNEGVSWALQGRNTKNPQTSQRRSSLTMISQAAVPKRRVTHILPGTRTEKMPPTAQTIPALKLRSVKSELRHIWNLVPGTMPYGFRALTPQWHYNWALCMLETPEIRLLLRHASAGKNRFAIRSSCVTLRKDQVNSIKLTPGAINTPNASVCMLYMYIYICTYVIIYIWEGREREREREL